MASLIPLTDRHPAAALFRLPGRRVTAAGFAADAGRLAQALPASGFAINICSGRYQFAVGFAAAALRGQTTLLAGDRSPDALRGLAARFADAYAVTDGEDPAPLPCVRVPPPGDDIAPIPSLPADHTAAIVFTSGSTGEPAPHAKPWRALAERSRDAALAFGLIGEAPFTVVGTVPPQHMYGFETTVLLPLHAPVESWCGPAFYPADIRAAVAEAAGGDCVLVTTPLQLRTLLGAGSLGKLARVISATAPLDPEVAEAAERGWQTTVSEIFGATEIGSIASRRTAAGDVWTPYQQVRLQAAGDAILVCAPGLAAVPLDDVIDLLPGGGFRLVGRRADLVKMGGRRASLSSLNRALAAIDGIEDGAFLPPAVTDRGAACRMTAVVVAPSQGRAAILAALRTRIDPAFLPRRIVHVDCLPRNEFGKLPLGALRALAEAG